MWQPALDAGLSPDDFSWSGENRHGARVAGARKLAGTLAECARRWGATEESPLVVNFVAHSHGGNVLLEALRRLDERLPVRPGRVVLLGTPLIAFRPALRLFRLAVAIAIAVSVLGLGVLILARLVAPRSLELGCEVLGACAVVAGRGIGAGWLVLVLAGMVVASRWVFLLAAGIGDVVWRVACLPILTARERRAGQVYGPEPRALGERLGGRRVLLVTSHQDEADLLLELSAAPRRWYTEWVKATFSRRGRALEWVFLRPIVVGVVLRVLETVLERAVLGFPWLRVLFLDHDLANLDTGPAYPPLVIERVDVTRMLLDARRIPAVPATGRAARTPEPPGLRGDERRVASLRQRLRAVALDLLAQIHPRHSDYYQSEPLVELVAEVLAGSAPLPAGEGSPRMNLGPPEDR